MKQHTRRGQWMALGCLLLACTAGAQEGARAQNTPEKTTGATLPASTPAASPLTPQMRREVIDGALERLRKSYVFPETAARMEEAIRQHEKQNAYADVTDGRRFAQLLTEHLQAVSHDKHLRILYSDAPIIRPQSTEPSPEELQQMQQRARTFNYGFEKVERLSGNVGYLDLRGFMPPELAGDTLSAAMNFLANTDALILDLRYNGGGEPEMVQLLCSYFFEEATHLNDLYFRPENTTRQYWTLPYVPGKRYGKKPIYVLTASRTFSGAEECCYNLKTQKRATLVGQTTGGGAHPGGEDLINAHFAVWVPMGRAINPITKTNWEGTGVTPDIAVPEERALETAHRAALTKLIAEEKNPLRKTQLEQALQTLKPTAIEDKARTPKP